MRRRSDAGVISRLEQEVSEPLVDLITRAEQAAVTGTKDSPRMFTRAEQTRFDTLLARLSEFDRRMQAAARCGSIPVSLREERLAVWREAKMMVEMVTLVRSWP